MKYLTAELGRPVTGNVTPELCAVLSVRAMLAKPQ